MATQTPDFSAMILEQKAEGSMVALPTIDPDLINPPPSDSHPFQVNSQPAPAYPLPGAAAVALLTFQVSPGMFGVITSLVILSIGGGFSDFSGNVVFRCLINGAGVDGLENITAQMGSLSSPVAVQIVLNQNDTFTITAEVPAGQPPMPAGATAAARIQGWTYALALALL